MITTGNEKPRELALNGATGQAAGGKPTCISNDTTSTATNKGPLDPDVIRAVETSLMAAAWKPTSEGLRVNCPQCQPPDTGLHFYWNTTKHTGNCKKCGFSPRLYDLAGLQGVAIGAKEPRPRINLADLARDKGLDPAWLASEFGLYDLPRGGVAIPYRSSCGETRHAKKRTALRAKEGSYWPKDTRLMPYGLDKWGQTAKVVGWGILVEGESDTWTGHLLGFPCLGIPGAASSSVLESEHLERVQDLYILEESDEAGRGFVEGCKARLRALGFKGNAYVLRLPHKDLNETHKMEGESCSAAIQAAIEAAEVIPPAPPAQETEQHTRCTLHSAKEAFQPVEPPEQVVAGLAPRPGVSVFYGESGHLKTWKVKDMAINVTLGRDYLGLATKQGPVLWIDEESGDQRFRYRLRQLLNGKAITEDQAPPLFYTTLAPFDIRDQLDIAAIAMLVEQVRPVMLVIDALVDVVPGADENSVKDMQPAMQNLRSLANRYNLAVIVIHHSNKAGGYRGTTAIRAAADLVVKVEADDADPSNPDNRRVHLTVEKSRDSAGLKLSAEVCFGVLSVTISRLDTTKAKADHFTKGERYVIRFMEGQPSRKARMSEVTANADSCSASTARDSVYKLVDRGLMRRCDGGKRGQEAEFELLMKTEEAEECAF